MFFETSISTFTLIFTLSINFILNFIKTMFDFCLINIIENREHKQEIRNREHKKSVN